MQFPQFKKNKFFVTGESYAGMMIPLLTLRIVDNLENNGINLQGLAIGNALTNYKMNDNSVIFFGYYHALLDQE